MERRTFLLGLISAAAVLVVAKPEDALAQAVECYDPAGRLVPCPPPGVARPRGIVRRAARRHRRRRRRGRRVRHRRVRRRVRRARRRMR